MLIVKPGSNALKYFCALRTKSASKINSGRGWFLNSPRPASINFLLSISNLPIPTSIFASCLVSSLLLEANELNLFTASLYAPVHTISYTTSSSSKNGANADLAACTFCSKDKSIPVIFSKDGPNFSAYCLWYSKLLGLVKGEYTTLLYKSF